MDRAGCVERLHEITKCDLAHGVPKSDSTPVGSWRPGKHNERGALELGRPR